MVKRRSYHIDGIQILRALCAGFVVVSHENGFLEFEEYFGFSPIPSLHITSLFAVSTFFSISGFIISVSSLDNDGHPSLSVRDFFIRRAARILPFLWLCTLTYNALSGLGTGRLDIAATIRTILVFPIGDLKPNVIWSIRHELAFYVLFGSCIIWLREKWWLLILWCAAPLLAAPAIWDWGIIGERDGNPAYDLFKLLIAGGDSGANLDFGAGLIAGAIHRKWQAQSAPWPPCHYAIVVLLFLASCTFVHITSFPSGLMRSTIWALLAGLLVLTAAFAQPAGRDPIGRLLCRLGDSSFSLYLMHNTVMLILLAVAMKTHLHLGDRAAAGLFLIACVVISVAACEVLYLYGERPLTRWSRQKMLALAKP